MWKTNKTPRQGVCTTYVGHRRLPGLPKERRHKVPPRHILEAQAKLVGLASLHAPDGNSARKEENEKRPHRGNQSFQELVCFLYFSGSLIYFLLYIGMNTESSGVSRPDLYQNQVLHINIYEGLRGFTSSSSQGAC